MTGETRLANMVVPVAQGCRDDPHGGCAVAYQGVQVRRGRLVEREEQAADGALNAPLRCDEGVNFVEEAHSCGATASTTGATTTAGMAGAFGTKKTPIAVKADSA